MVRLILFLLLQVSGCAVAFAIGADDAIVDKAKRATFIVSDAAKDSGGTGFVVNVGVLPMVVTNRHVCGNDEAVILTNDFTGERYNGSVLKLGKIYDVCLIIVDAKGTAEFRQHNTALTIKQTSLTPLSLIWTVGYPRLKGPHFQSGFIEAVAIMPVTLSSFDGFVPIVRASFEAYSGQSGSPILDNNGNVIGMLMISFTDQGYRAGFIPAGNVINVLSGRGASR